MQPSRIFQPLSFLEPLSCSVVPFRFSVVPKVQLVLHLWSDLQHASGAQLQPGGLFGHRRKQLPTKTNSLGDSYKATIIVPYSSQGWLGTIEEVENVAGHLSSTLHGMQASEK